MAECSSRRLVHPFDAAWPRPRESVRPLPSTSRSNDRQREIATFSAPPGTARDVSDVLLFQSRASRPSTRSSPPFRINDLLSIDFPRWKVRGMSVDPKEIESGDKGLNRRALGVAVEPSGGNVAFRARFEDETNIRRKKKTRPWISLYDRRKGARVKVKSFSLYSKVWSVYR